MGIVGVFPTIFIIAALLLAPACFALWLSVFDNGWTFKGFRALWGDTSFFPSLRTSLWYSTLTVVLQLAVGTFAAAVVHRLRHMSGIIAWLVFIPYAIPSVVAVVGWKFLILDHAAGPAILEQVLGVRAQAWMGDRIVWTLVAVSIWQFYPFVFLSILARMRRIPPALYRSAELDGASDWQQFKSLTFPSIKGTLLTVAVLRFAFMFSKFDTPWLLGGSTANDAVQTLPVYVYQNMGMDLHFKTGIAAAVVMALILFTVVTIIFGLKVVLESRQS
jgi:multiple sugar transport system permease protein